MSQRARTKFALLVMVLVTAGGAWLSSAVLLLQQQAGMLSMAGEAGRKYSREICRRRGCRP